jgi:hypothetical protein
MKKAISVLLALLVMVTSLAAVSKHKALLVSGTTSDIPKEAVGVISTDDKKALTFHWDFDRGFGEWSLPYDKVTSVSYGQHVGRGVASSIALGVTTLGVGAVPMLFSKKRQHFFTFEFIDGQGSSQTAVFEVGKGTVDTLLAVMERRTGKKVRYEDDPEERKTASK